ncbi:MAG: aminotransferase class III-fold pyridoxal phosphate-dependent enzyme [Candidatus Aminicenantes bacterium]|nr:aminotransferase class III-fold pyridoxal phosphate-dependent enzyme [Candidatus Aminicenantes bacterium]
MSNETVAARPRPAFKIEEASGILRRLYGRDGTLRELPSERDQNFHVRVGDGEEAVLKISNAAEKRDVLDFQNAVLAHLEVKCPDLNLPRLRRTTDGAGVGEAVGASGDRHAVRLLTFLPGKFLALVKPQKPELLRDIGRFLGRLSAGLAGFDRPMPERDLKWDMRRAPETVRRFLPLVADANGRALVESSVADYESTAGPLFPRLRTGLLYNDANDYNILVGDGPGGLLGRLSRVAGFIDFGDMTAGWVAVEPAVAAAYAMMAKDDPLEAAAHVVAGFQEARPLAEEEIAVIFPFAVMRLSLSVAISAEQHARERDNDYLRVSEAPAWELLRKLRDINPRFAHYVFRAACGFEACPRTRAVVSWLRDHRREVGSIVGTDLKKNPPLVLDLSAASLEFGPFSMADREPVFTAHILGRMAAEKKAVAVGRYDEARTAYTTDAFRVKRNDGWETRTVHLGLDIFMAPGKPVFAPLDGVVRGARDNAAFQDYGPTIILEHALPAGPAFYTLYGHLSRASLAGLREGQRVRKGDRIAEVGPPPENGGWSPHLHFQVITDLLDRRGEFAGVALPSQRDVWLSLCPDPNLILGLEEDIFPPAGRSKDEILRLRLTTLNPALSTAYRTPLKIVRGERQHLYDENGQPYLDTVNNVAHVGHAHPRVVAAAARQMAVLNTNTRYLHDAIVAYARRLTALLPAPLRICFFTNSGSEANDLALRLAWTHTGRKDVIVLEGAYHGNLSSLIDISPYKFDGPGGKGAPAHARKVVMPDTYRGRFRSPDPDAGKKYAVLVAETVEALRREGRAPAAFISESLPSCGGQIILPDGYLKAVYRAVREAGGLAIADEVQVGFGRLGTHFWGFETQGVVPDIVTLGKPIGNGHPLGAVVTTPEVAGSFRTGMEYFNTFGGNPVSCAVGLAVLDVVEKEGLQAKALEVGRHFKRGLEGLKDKHALIGDVRGLGLFLGVEFVRDREGREPAGEEAGYIAERMRDNGILASTDGPGHNVIKIKPPLVFTKENADFYVATLDRILGEDALGGSPKAAN